MGHLKLFFLLFLLPLLSSAAKKPPNKCPQSFCGVYQIQFPFRLVTQQPEICSYPGFNVQCNEQQGLVVVNILNSGDFFVRHIDYSSQSIQIYDPNNCNAARLLNLDFSASPFSFAYYENYTLLSCPAEVTQSRFSTIDCLSNSSYSTIATTSMSLATEMANHTACRITGSLQSPVSEYQDQFGLSSDLNEDIFLTWGTPDCQDCVANDGTCGFTNSTMQEVTCFGQSENSNNKAVIAVVIASAVMGTPAIIAAIACFICYHKMRVVTATPTRNTSNAATVTPEAAMVTTSPGLDQSTIESYTKVVLGESKRLPGHSSDATCPICLSEYHVKETVRCIPECRHCFHADCIDEWLKIKGTCPICRNSPSPVSVDS